MRNAETFIASTVASTALFCAVLVAVGSGTPDWRGSGQNGVNGL